MIRGKSCQNEKQTKDGKKREDYSTEGIRLHYEAKSRYGTKSACIGGKSRKSTAQNHVVAENDENHGLLRKNSSKRLKRLGRRKFAFALQKKLNIPGAFNLGNVNFERLRGFGE